MIRFISRIRSRCNPPYTSRWYSSGDDIVIGEDDRLHPRIRKMKLVPKIEADLKNEVYGPRKHPGNSGPRRIEIPEHILKSIAACAKDQQKKQLHEQGEQLMRYVRHRQPPLEHYEEWRQKCELKRQFTRGAGININEIKRMSWEEGERLNDKIEKEVARSMKATTYNWKPLELNEFQTFVYLFGRSALEYSVIYRTFREIAKRDPTFIPNSFFDFGSGVGTGTWAAAEFWKSSIYEYFNVDTSPDMVNLADLILRGGNPDKSCSLKNVYYRRFLPGANDAMYDLVLSAYTLMELENQQKRLEAILNLWNKCSGYLVIIEEGTKHGFQLITEARNIILDAARKSHSGNIFAPCPHDDACPRVALQDGTPCNFPTTYVPLKLYKAQADEVSTYSYVVFKKVIRKADDQTLHWPRVIRNTLVRSGHSICTLCTAEGTCERVVFKKAKLSKQAYHCGKFARWGDQIPIIFTDIVNE